MSKITLKQIREAIQTTLDSMAEGREYVISKDHLAQVNKFRLGSRFPIWRRDYWRWKKENGKLYESGKYVCQATGEEIGLTAMETETVMVTIFMLGEIEPLEKDLTLGDLEPGEYFEFARLPSDRQSPKKFLGAIEEYYFVEYSKGGASWEPPDSKVRRVKEEKHE